MDRLAPVHAKVDKGAKGLMIIAHMAEQMGIAEDDLEPEKSYITAVDTLEAPWGVTKSF